MAKHTSRRIFLAGSLGIPAAALAAASNEPQVVYRALGKTGLKVSALGFGSSQVSDPAVIERAVDLGVNFFDTARSSGGGNNERMIGAALKGKRDKVILGTKSGAKNARDALQELDTSLKELGTDYVDVWYLHSKNSPKDITDDLLEVQQQAKKAGKIRFAGVSFHLNMPEVLSHLVKLGRVDVALVSYNFTMEPNVGEAIREARKSGLGIATIKAMAGGYARIERGDKLYGQDPLKLTARLKQPGAMAAALKWVRRNEAVDSAVVGITDFDELAEDIRAISEPFREEDTKLLARQLEMIRPLYCRMCGACGGVCDKGVHVADTLRCLTYADGYGQVALARERYLQLPDGARKIRCADCSVCSVNCPNGVSVRSRLIKAQELL
jgi:LSD1 subclass zinc finger protein